jgi:capsular polysaccharide biosynthesis protein
LGGLGRDRVESVRCGRGVLQFAGFDREAVATTMNRFDYVGSQDPPLLELADVLFLPELRCLYTSDGRLIEQSKVTYIEPGAPAWFNDSKISKIERQSMPPEVEPPPHAARVRDPVLFLGEAHDHYGHFITDTLSRMWALDRFAPDMKVLFAPDPKGRLEPAFVRLVLERLGLGASRILRPQGPVRFDRLWAPVPALQLSRIYQGFDAPHVRAAATARGEAPDRPVYLTRTGLSPVLRKPGGEQDLELRLEAEGFLIVRPETLDLDQQIAIFNSPHPVVGAYGSAMHTVLFRTHGEQRLATLFPEKIPPRFVMVDAIKGARALYANCLRGEAVAGPDGEPGERRWAIDSELAMAQLDAGGFFSR